MLLMSGLAFVELTATEAPALDQAGKTLAIERSDVPPKPIKREAPVYPYSQNQAGLIGTVKVEFIIDKEGQVRNPFVVESNNPAFERPALDAILKWKYTPGVKSGRPVNTRTQQVIQFELHGVGWDGGQRWQINKTKNQANLPPEMQWDTAPVPVSTAFPVFPYGALQAETKGKTRLSFVVGPSGRVVQARVVEATTPEMGQATLAMIGVWRFKPAKKKDGTPAFAVCGIEHEFYPSGSGDVPVTDAAHDILHLLAKHPEKIVAADQLDVMPNPVSRRPPVYPLALEEAGQPGEALIEFFIDQAGDAQLPRIVSSSAPEFGYAAVQAVAAWRFEPPKKNGKTVITRARVPLNFKLEPAHRTANQHP